MLSINDFDTIREIFERNCPHNNVTVILDEYAIILEPTDDQMDGVGAECIRSVGKDLLDEGYYIEGFREYLDTNVPMVEVWPNKLEE